MSANTSPSSRTFGSNSSEPFDGEAEIVRAWRRGLAPDPALTVSEWADRYRILSSRAASEAGRYRTERTPYMRDIMDALSPMSPARRIVFMKAAQVGATEAGNNWIGYCIHQAPGPFLAVQPTTDLAKRLSQQRVEPLIDECPELRALIMPSRSRDAGNTVLAKRFAGGQLVLTGANSAVGLRSMPARWLFLDEIDAYEGDVDGEGDPIALAEARTRTFGHRRKVFLVSTPTIKGFSRIEREFEASDQRRFFLPCPHCSHMQWLKFERLEWETGKPETAVYTCEACNRQIAEHHKTAMLAAGEWRGTADCADPTVAGFHISGLYSPVGWLSWAQIAREWEAAKGNDAALKAAKNTLLGETWQERGEAPDWQRLYERREARTLGIVPRGALVLTAGADVQHDRIEVDVWAWGPRLESWLVDHIVIDGDTARPEIWDRLSELLVGTWRGEAGRAFAIAKLAIDSGDGRTTDAVYAWARRMGSAQVAAIKGIDGFNRVSPVDGPTYVDATERGRKIRRGAKLWKVAVAVFKSETYRFLRLDAPTDEEIAQGKAYPDGYIHLPRGITGEWVKQLTAEQLVSVRDRRGFSRLEWRTTRERNEALDARVYARAALWIVGADRCGAAFWTRMATQLGATPEETQTSEPQEAALVKQTLPRRSFIGGRRNRWLG